MTDATQDPAPQSPLAGSAQITDAELAAAVRKAAQLAPDEATQARLDRRVAEVLKSVRPIPRVAPPEQDHHD